MARNYTREKRQFAVEALKKRQDERFARKLSTELDEKCRQMEATLDAVNEKTAGLTASLEDVVEGNKRLVDSVLLLMDVAKIKEAPNTTKRKLQKLKEKYGDE